MLIEGLPDGVSGDDTSLHMVEVQRSGEGDQVTWGSGMSLRIMLEEGAG